MQSHAQNSTEPEADQTYFEMFSLPRKLIIDTSALERDFYKLSRKLQCRGRFRFPDDGPARGGRQRMWARV